MIIGKCNTFVLIFRTPNLVNKNVLIYIFLMISEHLKCVCKPKVIWEVTESSFAACQPKYVFRTIKINILILITVKLLPRFSKLNKLFLIYTLSFQIKKK